METKQINKRNYTGNEACICGGDLEEIEQNPNMENNSTIFIMECLECKKKYSISSVYFIEEVA